MSLRLPLLGLRLRGSPSSACRRRSRPPAARSRSPRPSMAKPSCRTASTGAAYPSLPAATGSARSTFLIDGKVAWKRAQGAVHVRGRRRLPRHQLAEPRQTSLRRSRDRKRRADGQTTPLSRACWRRHEYPPHSLGPGAQDRRHLRRPGARDERQPDQHARPARNVADHLPAAVDQGHVPLHQLPVHLRHDDRRRRAVQR